MSNFLAEPVRLFPIRPARAIGEITGYIVFDENTTDDLEITSHPVQQGAAITDHAFKKPVELSVRLQFGPHDKPLDEIYEDLLVIQASRDPFTVYTGKRTLYNMLIKSISQTTDKTTENVLAISLRLQEIIIVEVTPTSVPPRGKQKTPGGTGATEKAGKKSALLTGAEAVGFR